MRNTVSIAVGMLLASAALVCGQGAEPATPPTVVIEERPSILPGRRAIIVAESAEAAEELAEAQERPRRVWLRSEFLVWWIKTASLPVLVTTGSISDIRPGALDSINTRGRFGGNNADFQDRGGGRFTLGWWLADDQQLGVEGSYFFLSGRSLGQTFTSPGNPVLARPFTNVNTGLQDATLIAFPGITSGSVAVDVPSFLQGGEMNLVSAVAKGESTRWQAIGGFRYLNLDDGLHINETSVVTLAPQYKGLGIPYDGNTIRVSDRFDTRNHFYGAQLGGRMEYRRKRFTLDTVAKVALGVSHAIITIRGNTSIDTQPAFTQHAGLLALSTNSGVHTGNAFAVVPEVGMNLRFDLTNRIHVFGGYSFLYWSSVARPWDQVDVNVNVNRVPTSSTFGSAAGPTRPAFDLHSTSFFAHGANFGVEFQF